MFHELLSLILAPLFVTVGVIYRSQALWISIFGALVMFPFRGMRGAALVVLAIGLAMQEAKPGWKRLALRLGSGCTAFAILILSILIRSGRGRWLGIFEAGWMAIQSHGKGVGIGQWTFHQAEAQRAILSSFSFESWREIAPFFGVAPSLPAHLLAESGWVALGVWFVLLAGTALGVVRIKHIPMRASFATLLTLLLVSAWTTPIQFYLYAPRESVIRCDTAISGYLVETVSFKEVDEHCPEIRALEFRGNAMEKEGDAETARKAYFDWYRTFPKDVMPAYALGRLAARDGDSEQALNWFRIAAIGVSGKDEKAMVLRQQAQSIVNGGTPLLDLWSKSN